MTARVEVTLERSHLHPNAIAATVLRVAAYYGVPAVRIMQRHGTGQVRWARHVMHWLLREAGMTLPTIADVSRRHHTTVMGSVSIVDAEIKAGTRRGREAWYLSRKEKP